MKPRSKFGCIFSLLRPLMDGMKHMHELSLKARWIAYWMAEISEDPDSEWMVPNVWHWMKRIDDEFDLEINDAGNVVHVRKPL